MELARPTVHTLGTTLLLNVSSSNEPIRHCIGSVVVLRFNMYTCSGSTTGLLCFVYNSQEELARMGCFSARQGVPRRTLNSQWLINHSAWIIMKVGTQQPFDTFWWLIAGHSGEDQMTSQRRARSGHFKPSWLIAGHLGGKPNGLFEGR